MNLREVQERLQAKGLYADEPDDRMGPKTRAAINAFALAQRVDLDAWDDERRILAAQQLLCRIVGIDIGTIDGLRGPQTRHAFEVYDARKANGGKPNPKIENFRDADDGKPPLVPLPQAASVWPRQADCSKFYGPVGANQTMLAVPAGWGMVLAWDVAKPVSKFSVHEKIHDAAARVLDRVLDHYKPEGIRELGLHLFGGALNVRKMRGGSAWSMHSWGIAIDFDPERNQLKWNHTRARLAKPDAAKFFDLWEAEGFVSLGRARDYDWMHVQAARL